MSCRNGRSVLTSSGNLIRVAALLSALALAAVSLAVYSPLHTHDAWKPGPCALCQFQCLTAETAASVSHLPLPLESQWCHFLDHASLAPSESACPAVHGRAPPASPSAF